MKSPVAPASVHSCRTAAPAWLAAPCRVSARTISERRVKSGLRRALLVQARRLEHLASQRLKDIE